MKSFSSAKFILTILLAGLFACEKDFEELNKNPFQPTQTEIGPLFNSIVESMTMSGEEQLYLHNEILYSITQQAALTATTFQNVSIGTEAAWNNYYSALADIREIENRIASFDGEAEAMNNIAAMLKTVLAYKTFRLTDLFGGIPFFDAGKGFENPDLLRPAFDSQQDIYKFLLDELKWVVDNANTTPAPTTSSGTPYESLDGFDVLLDEDIERWVKFANSLRLRYAIRMVEVEPTFAEPIIQDILENDLPLIEEGEEVALWPQQLAWKKTSTHWSFREHRKLRLGSNIWRFLSENDSIDGSGIYDHRAHLFFEPNNADEWAPFPQLPDADTPVSGGSPYSGLRDDNYSFKGLSNIYSPFNYYLIRDEDYIPELLFSAAEVHFLKAEAYLRGLGVAPDEGKADDEYRTGIPVSIRFWNSLAVNAPIWVNQPPELGPTGEFQTVNHTNVLFANDGNNLLRIYTQRWIDAFRQPWEAYALGRRTQATPVEGQRASHYRFPYPPSEVENNPDNWAQQVARMGADTETTKVWWMN